MVKVIKNNIKIALLSLFIVLSTACTSSADTVIPPTPIPTLLPVPSETPIPTPTEIPLYTAEDLETIGDNIAAVCDSADALKVDFELGQKSPCDIANLTHNCMGEIGDVDPSWLDGVTAKEFGLYAFNNEDLSIDESGKITGISGQLTAYLD